MKNLCALLAATALCAPAWAETLRIGVSADYPPWESVDQNNQIIGFDRDVGDEVCARIAAECTWINQAYDGLLPGLQIGKFDLVISGISITDERAKQVDFSAAYADAPNTFFGRADSALVGVTAEAAVQDALADKIIGVQVGTTHSAVLDAHFEGATVRNYDRPEQVVDDVLSGRLDAGLMERSALAPFLEGSSGDKLAQLGPLLTSADFSEFGQGQAVALRKGREDLKARIGTAIIEMIADGTMADLSTTWFGYDLSFKGAQ